MAESGLPYFFDNELVARLRERHGYVAIGAPTVSRWQGVLPRYEVSWTEKIDEHGAWGGCRTIWFQRRAYNFAARFVVVQPALKVKPRDWYTALCERVAA